MKKNKLLLIALAMTNYTLSSYKQTNIYPENVQYRSTNLSPHILESIEINSILNSLNDALQFAQQANNLEYKKLIQQQIAENKARIDYLMTLSSQTKRY